MGRDVFAKNKIAFVSGEVIFYPHFPNKYQVNHVYSDTQQVVLNDGATLKYSSLLIASGSIPQVLIKNATLPRFLIVVADHKFTWLRFAWDLFISFNK